MTIDPTLQPTATPSGSTTAHTLVDSPLGTLALVTDGQALTGVFMEDHRHTHPNRWGPELAVDLAPAVIREAAEQLSDYFDGARQNFDLLLAPAGTEFQRQVWSALRGIPYGATATYGEIATALQRPGASRAVGLANGRNPISIIVPCHRVVGADGSMTGYGGGIERKQRLLALERGAQLPIEWGNHYR